MKIKKVLILLVIMICVSCTLPMCKVQAALQSSGDVPSAKNRDTWMTQVRNIETLGGGFGLSETINADLTSSSGSNNIDIHMQKNTEYGAMALLSASSYGNPEKIENGGTTTGNKSGIVIPYNKEWTATQYTDLWTKNVAERYINYYNIKKNLTRRSGDALLETQGWHGTSYFYAHYQSTKVGSYSGYYKPSGLVRNLGDGIFGYNNSVGFGSTAENTHLWDVGNRIANISNEYTSRAVIINGEGI